MSAIEVEIREFGTDRPVGDSRTQSSKTAEEVIDYLRGAGYVDMREIQGEPPDFVLVLWRVSVGFADSTPPPDWIGRFCKPGASLERIRQDLGVLHRGG